MRITLESKSIGLTGNQQVFVFLKPAKKGRTFLQTCWAQRLSIPICLKRGRPNKCYVSSCLIIIFSIILCTFFRPPFQIWHLMAILHSQHSPSARCQHVIPEARHGASSLWQEFLDQPGLGGEGAKRSFEDGDALVTTSLKKKT